MLCSEFNLSTVVCVGFVNVVTVLIHGMGTTRDEFFEADVAVQKQENRKITHTNQWKIETDKSTRVKSQEKMLKFATKC